jgi:hypothetical protein
MGPVLKRAVAAAATLMLVAVACGGCTVGQTFTSIVPANNLSPTPRSTWGATDLPVPEGFVQDKGQSHVLTKGVRNLKLVYKREPYVDVDRTWEFYV